MKFWSVLFLAMIASGAQAAEVGDTVLIPRSAISCAQYPVRQPCFGCTKPPVYPNASLAVWFPVDGVRYLSSRSISLGCATLLAGLPENGAVEAVVIRKELLPPTGPSETGVLELELRLPNSFRVTGRGALH